MNFVLLPALVLLCLWAYVRFIESTTIFLPDKTLTAFPSDEGLNYEDLWAVSEDGFRLHGWFLWSSFSSPDGPVILLLHGNAGNISSRLAKARRLCKAGYRVYLTDYRGYGLSQGHPTEKGVYRDARAFYHALRENKQIPEEKIVIYGVSLGGAVAVDLAIGARAAALILESTFSSAADMAKVILPFVPTILLSVRFDSLSKIKDCSLPLLMIHSQNDETVPYALGRKLFSAAPGPKEWVTISGPHNEGFFHNQDQVMEAISSWIERYAGSTRS